MQLLIIGCISATERVTTDCTILVERGPDPAPVGLGPSVLLAGYAEKLRGSCGKFIDLEPVGHTETLIAYHVDIGSRNTEAFFFEFYTLRAGTIGFAAGVSKLSSFIDFNLDVGGFTVGGERLDFGESTHFLAGDLNEGGKFTSGFLTARRGFFVTYQLERVATHIG